jgi:hypothetical protein
MCTETTALKSTITDSRQTETGRRGPGKKEFVFAQTHGVGGAYLCISCCRIPPKYCDICSVQKMQRHIDANAPLWKFRGNHGLWIRNFVFCIHF